MAKLILTIGHSNLSLDSFCELLAVHGVRAIADVRRWPTSRRFPQFTRATLEPALRDRGVFYRWLGRDLGGMRPSLCAREASANAGWSDEGFRNYADYMGTATFAAALEGLERDAARLPTAIMCAEAHYVRCHRQLIADALTVRGWEVRHIAGKESAAAHALTPLAHVDGDRLTYPPPSQQPSARQLRLFD